MIQNIAYKSDEIARYFARNRVRWTQFYESERVVISQLGIAHDDAILDIGCGCGGLGVALRERYGVEKYTGVEINASAAAAGRTLNPAAHILYGDILDLSENELRERRFNV